MAEKMRQLREARGMTREHLAGISDVTVKTIQRVETTGRASKESFRALATAFNMDVSEILIAGDADESPPRLVRRNKKEHVAILAASGHVFDPVMDDPIEDMPPDPIPGNFMSNGSWLANGLMRSKYLELSNDDCPSDADVETVGSFFELCETFREHHKTYGAKQRLAKAREFSKAIDGLINSNWLPCYDSGPDEEGYRIHVYRFSNPKVRLPPGLVERHRRTTQTRPPEEAVAAAVRIIQALQDGASVKELWAELGPTAKQALRSAGLDLLNSAPSTGAGTTHRRPREHESS